MSKATQSPVGSQTLSSTTLFLVPLVVLLQERIYFLLMMIYSLPLRHSQIVVMMMMADGRTMEILLTIKAMQAGASPQSQICLMVVDQVSQVIHTPVVSMEITQ